LLTLTTSGVQSSASGCPRLGLINFLQKGLRFVATAEHVASQLDASPQLEWSPALIGLCKAVEAEIIRRILGPLSTSGSDDLTADKNDKDVGRIARFCSDPSMKAPELGTFAHFLQTVINSEHRRQTSPLMRRFLRITSDWTGSHWILDPDRFHKSLAVLTTDFRNRAAHIDELGKADYVACRRHVIGADGLLWNIISSTIRHR
jgi:hypothetical protein